MDRKSALGIPASQLRHWDEKSPQGSISRLSAKVEATYPHVTSRGLIYMQKCTLGHCWAPCNDLLSHREDPFVRWTPDVLTGRRSKWADGLAVCTQLDLRGAMLELCVPPGSARAADGQCGCVENALKRTWRLERKKWHYHYYYFNCCDLTCFSDLKLRWTRESRKHFNRFHIQTQ